MFMLEIFNITEIITNYGYIGIAIIVFLESGIFFALPGDSLLFTVGLLAGSTYLKLFIVIPIMIISGFLGGIAGYFIGIYIESLRRYNFFKKILKEEHINKSHNFFTKYGKKAIIIARFVPIVRTFLPIVAGIARMNFKTFIKYNLLSAIIWALSIPLIGYFLGRKFPFIRDYMPFIILLVVFLSIIPIIYEFLKKKKN